MIEYTPKQKVLMRLWQHKQLARINLLEGSVSSGKTWISLVLWAFWVKTMPADGLYLMCAKSITTLKRNCLLLLQEQVGIGNFAFSIAAKEGTLFGRRILLEGANDARSESKIRGLTLQGAYCDELTQFPKDFFAMLLSRLRLPEAKLIATTNPDSPRHWLKTDYIDRADKLDFRDIKFTMEDNTFLPPDYVAALETEYEGTVYYNRYILGEWSLAEGLIYPMHIDAIQDAPEGRAGQYVLSIDYGTQNAFAGLLWGKYGDVWYLVREYYYSGRDTGVQKTDEEYANALDNFVGDIAAPEYKLRVVIDPSAASFITLLRKRGKYRVIPADNDVRNGIIETARALKSGRIKIPKSNVNTIREFEGYIWDENAGEDRPVKANDHCMDSMRYFVKTLQIARTPDAAYHSPFEPKSEYRVR